jgi:hypothetical protein
MKLLKRHEICGQALPPTQALRGSSPRRSVSRWQTHRGGSLA